MKKIFTDIGYPIIEKKILGGAEPITYYLYTEYQVIKLIVFTHDLLGNKIKYGKGKNIDKIKEGNIGKLIRKYAPLIGVDNMLKALNNLKQINTKKTIKDIEREFKKYL